MAQTELMLRLIKDGKIVGELKIKTNKQAKGVVTTDWFATTTMYKGEENTIPDSFELGLKVGDEWVFGEYERTQYGIYSFIESKIGEKR